MTTAHPLTRVTSPTQSHPPKHTDRPTPPSCPSLPSTTTPTYHVTHHSNKPPRPVNDPNYADADHPYQTLQQPSPFYCVLPA